MLSESTQTNALLLALFVVGAIAAGWWWRHEEQAEEALSTSDRRQRRRTAKNRPGPGWLVVCCIGLGFKAYLDMRTCMLYDKGSAYASAVVLRYYSKAEHRNSYIYTAERGWHREPPGPRSPITLYYTYEVGEWRYQGNDTYPGADSRCPLTPGARCWVRYPLADPAVSRLVVAPPAGKGAPQP